MAISAHSGISRPSRKRLIPINISKTPNLRSLIISIRSRVSISEWRYLTLSPSSCIYSVKSSDIFFVNVVIITLYPFEIVDLHSSIKLSI